MHQFDAECDPACEYLTAVHAFLICILLTLSLSLSHIICICLFSSLLLFLSIHHQISGISPWEPFKYYGQSWRVLSLFLLSLSSHHLTI